MVEIINNQKGKHTRAVNFLEDYFKQLGDTPDSDLFVLTTQDYNGFAEHNYNPE